jgi:ADP-ribose pyrophosphatase
VIEKTDFVTIAAIDAGYLHLVQQYRYPVQGRYWELPQGAWEQSPGTDPLELARAELREETGLEATEMVLAGHLFQGYGFSTQGYYIFLASGLRQGNADLDIEEQDLITRPFALAEVEAMVRDGVIQDATTVAALGLLKLKGMI